MSATGEPTGHSEPLLEVEDLRVAFRSEDARTEALAGVSFRIFPRETVCLVGESGCGKTLTSLSILRILPPTARIEAGRILYRGERLTRGNPGGSADLLALSEEQMREVRGREIGMIFQEPMTSLNPVLTVGHQIEEAIRVHERLSDAEARERVIRLLQDVGIPAPEERRHDYPHQLSGGQRQRVMIAIALACHPPLVIADEPTTALDVTIQAQILRLFEELQQKRDMSLLYITHDLRVVAHLGRRIYVMYAGVIAEEGAARDIFHAPRHPYTRGLMDSLPSKAKKGQPLHAIPGNVPDPARRPGGCPFHPRCPLVTPRCRSELPGLCDFGGGHKARCPVVHGSWPSREEAAPEVPPAQARGEGLA